MELDVWKEFVRETEKACENGKAIIIHLKSGENRITIDGIIDSTTCSADLNHITIQAGTASLVLYGDTFDVSVSEIDPDCNEYALVNDWIEYYISFV